MRPFMGNPCGYGNCREADCEKCRHWKPVVYIGKNYKELKLPKWNWLVSMLYRIEEKLMSTGNSF